MRFFIIVLAFLAAALWLLEGVSEHALFGAVTDVLAHYFGETAARDGIAAALVFAGIVLAWPTRPMFLRHASLRFSLQRDSGSDQIGIQTFPEISYIQVSLVSTVPIVNCRAWISEITYSENGISPYSIEHNERHPLNWSKHGGTDPLEAELSPDEPPVRLNIAVFNLNGIQLEPGVQTPTNLIGRLQRPGFHRFTIHFRAERHFEFWHLKYKSSFSQQKVVTIQWRGRGSMVSVALSS
jgi:hypothetical protein